MDSDTDSDSSIEEKHYLFRERVDSRIFSSAVFRENFRCTPEMAELLLQLIGVDIQAQYCRNHALRLF